MIEKINTHIPHQTNKRIIEYLTLNTKWMFACDKNEDHLIVNNITNAGGNDSGFIFKTFAKEHGCTEQSKRKIGEIIRIYWNMYVSSSKMKYHYDMPKESNCLSIVYNLHNNDGGTDFKNNKIIKSKEGQAIVFNSDNLHKGISSKNIPVRYALNIVCKTDD